MFIERVFHYGNQFDFAIWRMYFVVVTPLWVEAISVFPPGVPERDASWSGLHIDFTFHKMYFYGVTPLGRGALYSPTGGGLNGRLESIPILIQL